MNEKDCYYSLYGNIINVVPHYWKLDLRPGSVNYAPCYGAVPMLPKYELSREDFPSDELYLRYIQRVVNPVMVLNNDIK